MTPCTRWSVSASDLTGMTPAKARDLIVQCFHEAQKETSLPPASSSTNRTSNPICGTW